MDFLWNGYGFMILKNMDYGMDMDLVLVLNPSGPTDYNYGLYTMIIVCGHTLDKNSFTIL